jgi:hypothetical protein
MGYNTSFMLVRPVDELLICGVCTDMFEAPVQVCSEGCTLCQSCASAIKPRKCPLCQKPMKPAKSVKPNRLIPQMVEKIQTRCYNSKTGVDGGDGPPAKKIKTNGSAAASVPSVDGGQWTGPIGGLNKHAEECGFVKGVCPNDACDVSVYRHELVIHDAVCAFCRVACGSCKDEMLANLLPAHVANTCQKRLLACLNNGCLQASIPADHLPDHQAVCPCATVKCGFGGGKCDGTYKRGVGSSEHDREAMQTHLDIAMGLIEAQARTNEAQARTIKQLEERTNEFGTTKLHLKGIVSANMPVDSLVSDTIWFCGNQVQLKLEEGGITKQPHVFLYHYGPGAIPTYRQIDVFFKQKKVASKTHVKLRHSTMRDSLTWYCGGFWEVDAATAEAIKDGKDVYAIIHR